jgi:chromate reductase
MNKSTIQIAAINGSLRKKSLNRQLINSAAQNLPANTTLEILEIAEIPMFNQDLEKMYLPEAVRQFRIALQQADAILIATPEYNYSIPGVLKNAIDWASRSQDGKPGPLNEKPLAIMGAGGRAGTARAQNHLRQIASHLNMYTINKPEVLVTTSSSQVFDHDGNLIDITAINLISQLLENLAVFTRKMHSDRFHTVNMN